MELKTNPQRLDSGTGEKQTWGDDWLRRQKGNIRHRDKKKTNMKTRLTKHTRRLDTAKKNLENHTELKANRSILYTWRKYNYEPKNHIEYSKNKLHIVQKRSTSTMATPASCTFPVKRLLTDGRIMLATFSISVLCVNLCYLLTGCFFVCHIHYFIMACLVQNSAKKTLN